MSGNNNKHGDAAAMMELLRDMVAASDANDGERLLNCLEFARELIAPPNAPAGKE
jgi:hypothetical protein